METAETRIRELEALLQLETAARVKAETDLNEEKQTFDVKVKLLKTKLSSMNGDLLAMTTKYDNYVHSHTVEVTGLNDMIKRLEEQVRIGQTRLNSEKGAHDQTKAQHAQCNKELRIATNTVKKQFGARETTSYVPTEADPDKHSGRKYTRFMAERFINSQFDPTKKNSHELAIERGLKKLPLYPKYVPKIPQWASKKVHDFRLADGI
uniref:Reverse transcriptase domain-containing protein n=1 Tax=Panagrellus redivivus TaxID=6233 RepID=A0A7E4V1B2_PANRE